MGTTTGTRVLCTQYLLRVAIELGLDLGLNLGLELGLGPPLGIFHARVK